MTNPPTARRSLLNLSQTSYVWLFVSLMMIGLTLQSARWRNKEVFVSDQSGYYLYLPSTFATHDLGNGEWVKAARTAYQPKADPQREFLPLPNGKTVFKYPMGMAVAWSPFFFLARTIYYLRGERSTLGYEPLYEYFVTWGCVAYVLLGLWVLGRELNRYFTDSTAALTLMVIGLGSNFLAYATHEVLMSHGLLFTVNVLLLRYTRRWYEGGQTADALCLGLVAGFMVLIRPSEVMLLGVPVLWGLTSGAAVAGRLRFWQQHWGQVLLAAALVALVGSLQFLFWRLAGDVWLVPFYKGETFNFKDPHVWDGIFSIRKGWLVYSPLMVFSVLGIAWLRRWAAPVLPALLVIVPVYFYVTFCWWDWGYGGSYGGRALISLYPLLAFSMAAFWQRWRQPLRWVWFPLVSTLLVLSVFQNHQYFIGLIDCCDMTWALYKERFWMLGWQTDIAVEWKQLFAPE
jgi:hypothetical protein